jgi:tryptophan halogenase
LVARRRIEELTPRAVRANSPRLVLRQAPAKIPLMVRKVIVLGGGSAGFMAAIALRLKIPGLGVTVIRSKDIGVIGVGEGSTPALTRFLHDYVGVGLKKFHEVAQPTWKLGPRFVRWGPRAFFHYGFNLAYERRVEGMPRRVGFYCDRDDATDYADPDSAMMTHDRVFARNAFGGPAAHNAVAYHFENEKFVTFLEGYAAAAGVRVVDDTVREVRQDENGVAGLVLKGGTTETADLYVDSSGFVSLLLGKTFGEPFTSFKSSLFCDRAVVGGWNRADSPDPADQVIKPYTMCETMDAGWCWQIEHEGRINRGYVHSSDFISEEEAEREFRAKNPKVGPTRFVKFVSGCYRNAWVKNVVAVGNASGFVEPMEATALGVIALQSRLLVGTLLDSGGEPRRADVTHFNELHRRNWQSIRAFIAVHYKFNTRLDTPFWRECRERVDLTPMAEAYVENYKECGPSGFWDQLLLEPFDQFGTGGYLALLVGQKVPYRRGREPTEKEWALWEQWRSRNKELAMRAMNVREALAAVRAPSWRWPPAPPGQGTGGGGR